MQFSIKNKLFVIIAGFVSISFVFLATFIALFYSFFYIENQKDLLRSSYLGLQAINLDMEIDTLSLNEEFDYYYIDEEYMIVESNVAYFKENKTNYFSVFEPDIVIPESGVTDLPLEIKGKNKLGSVDFFQIAFRTPNKENTLIIGKSLSKPFDVSRSFVILLILSLFPIIMLLYLFVHRISEYFTEPIIKLSEQTRNIANLDFTDKKIVFSSDEIGDLSKNLDLVSNSLETKIKQVHMQNNKLKEYLEKQKDFVSNISHELKTPITVIHGYSELLEAKLKKSKGDRHIKRIKEEILFMDNIITILLDISYMEKNISKGTLEDVDLKLLLKNVIDVYYKKEEEKKCIRIKFSGESFIKKCDETRLKMIFINYISNALKYKDDKTNIIVSLRSYEKGIEFTVKNQCKNMDEEKLNLLWENFYKTDTARNNRENGSGIGLYLVKTISNTYGYKFFSKKEGNEVTFGIIF